MTKIDNVLLVNRRTIIKAVAGVSAIPLVFSFMGCGGSSSDSSSNFNTGTSDDTSDDVSDDIADTTDGWASGGTSSMTDDFPDDSLFDDTSACSITLTQALTEGPCYFQSEYLDDISDEQTGLPMMLCLQLVDESCAPLSGYEIEVWHCDVDGIYSGDTSSSADSSNFNTSFCTGNDSDALQSQWFRGIAVTDASGRINLKSCFPGWYSSRAIHIHFRIKQNNSDELISQFGFSDTFVQDICVNHTDYEHRGAPDTLLGSDTVFSSDSDSYLFNTAQNSDGSLLAYKRIMLSA